MKKNVVALGVAALVAGATLSTVSLAAVIPPGPVSPGVGDFGGLNVVGGAPAATTLAVAPNGIGHKLIIPYFNAQQGNSTLINLVNTDSVHGKAVKVRFRSAQNSDDILDFTVFLSPNDVWTARVEQGASGLARLVTTDNSCTAPFNVRSADNRTEVATNFVPDRLNPNATEEQRFAWTREGYVEIFTMADIVQPTDARREARGIDDIGAAITMRRYGPDATSPTFYNVIKHNAAGVALCGDGLTGAAQTAFLDDLRLIERFDTAAEAAAMLLAPPTTGLMGNWTIARVGEGLSFTGEATAIVATDAAGTPGQGNFVMFPQSSESYADVRGRPIRSNSADPLFAVDPVANPDAFLQAAFFDLPDLSTPYTSFINPFDPAGERLTGNAGDQAIALSNTISSSLIGNEFVSVLEAQFRTDWTFSMPTRRYFVAVAYQANEGATAADPRRPGLVVNDGVSLHSVVIGTGAATNVNIQGDIFGFAGALASTTVKLVGDRACVALAADAVTPYDRSERTPTVVGQLVVSPSTPQAPNRVTLCGEVSVLSFNRPNTTASGVLGATSAFQNVTVPYDSGWATVRLNSSAEQRGLPVLGHAFMRAEGGITPGVNSNFGLTFEHRRLAGPGAP